MVIKTLEDAAEPSTLNLDPLGNILKMAANGELLPHQTPEYMAEDRGTTTISVIISVSVVSTLFVAARIFCRTRFAGKMYLDDWLVIISSVGASRLPT